ncbi:MAG: asparagine synthase (glutamine-hydrolyzing) [Spirochaetales bacterium]|nr:asparagine synthase (glutamine-hydrolyzing) [Spirochaetales bacterium]MCF7937745.1 asparagine synthase (glutamine-hydrolyzing) [Spirochaetales bacterium]
MCGIWGSVSSNKLQQQTAEQVKQVLNHRGPDAWGFRSYSAGSSVLNLVHTRLSILDTSDKGAQPFEDGELVVVYNGEVYNFLELREELSSLGHSFRSNSDTEVLLKAYRQYGIGFVERLEGMFSFVLSDLRKGFLHLVRDRIGQKPLYYFEGGGRLVFGSTVKSIFAEGTAVPRLHQERFFHTFAANYNRNGLQTVFHDINKVPPAHIYTYSLERRRFIEKRRYWQVSYDPKIEATESELVHSVEQGLSDAVRKRLISDVPLGFMLSGGIDSGMVVALAARHSSKLKTFSIGFGEEDYNELPFARQVAERYGTDHHEYVIDPDIVSVLEEVTRHLDEPVGDPSLVPLYYLSKHTRADVTVALNGDGGDELFFGYEKYKAEIIVRRLQAFPAILRRAGLAAAKAVPASDARISLVRRLRYGLGRSLEAGSIFRIVDYSRSELSSLFDSRTTEVPGSPREEFEAEEFIDAMMEHDYRTYLPEDLLVKADRMSMAHSLETRSPFLDHLLVEQVTRLPVELKYREGTLKYLLKRIARNHLPDSIIDRTKQGFGLPLDRWFREDLSAYFLEVLSESRLVRDGVLEREGIDRIYQDHQAGRARNGRKLFSLLSCELWYRSIMAA